MGLPALRDLDVTIHPSSNEFIVKNDRVILKMYSGYRHEQANFKKKNHYSILWGEKNIYL